MVDSLNYAFENGEMSISQKRGIISLIPKKDKDKKYLKNWRPISLLNNAYKIVTKALALCLEKVLPTIIRANQTGYVKGRYIGENCSGLRINQSKSEILWLGSLHQRKDSILNLKLSDETVYALGVYFSYDEELATKRNFFEKLPKLKKILNIILVVSRHIDIWKSKYSENVGNI